MLVRREGAGFRLCTRNGHDWTGRSPLIARAALTLKAASCLIDGEAVACGDDGLPVFDRLRARRDDRRVFLYAFDLIGEDLRREPIERRKAALAKLMRRATTGLVPNEHIDEPGDVVFRHACKLGGHRRAHWHSLPLHCPPARWHSLVVAQSPRSGQNEVPVGHDVGWHTFKPVL